VALIRDSRGRFGKGNDGGPGRPPGQGPAARLKGHLGDEKIHKMVDRLYDMALEGDTAAQRILMDRLYPVTDAKLEELRDAVEELRERIANIRSRA